MGGLSIEGFAFDESGGGCNHPRDSRVHNDNLVIGGASLLNQRLNTRLLVFISGENRTSECATAIKGQGSIRISDPTPGGSCGNSIFVSQLTLKIRAGTILFPPFARRITHSGGVYEPSCQRPLHFLQDNGHDSSMNPGFLLHSLCSAQP